MPIYRYGKDNEVIIRDNENGILSYIPICPGNLDYDNTMKLLNENQITIEAYTEPAKTVDQLRQIAYNEEGATIEALTIALVEKVVENRPESLEALQLKREAVKTKYPKS